MLQQLSGRKQCEKLCLLFSLQVFIFSGSKTTAATGRKIKSKPGQVCNISWVLWVHTAFSLYHLLALCVISWYIHHCSVFKLLHNYSYTFSFCDASSLKARCKYTTLRSATYSVSTSTWKITGRCWGRLLKGDMTIAFPVTYLCWERTETPECRLNRGRIITEWQYQS